MLTVVSTLFQHAIRARILAPLRGCWMVLAEPVRTLSANVALLNYSCSAYATIVRTTARSCMASTISGLLGCDAPLHKRKFQNCHVFGHSEELDEAGVSEF